MVWLKPFIALFNFIVAILNLKCYLNSLESRDFWTVIAWLAAGINWTISIFV